MILEPNRNVWRIERARRASVLLDGGGYFGALREALLKAQSTVFILGWDLDSRTRLVGNSGKADDGYPEGLIDFLTVLVNERPKLVVHILVWDYSVIYAMERELLPLLSIQWRTPHRIRYCLDDDLPAGASHHQKIVVIDDAIAFAGGLDLTVRRWDAQDHRIDNPHRVDPAGVAYRPYHDVQMMIDGPAVRPLAELVRERWKRGACERPRPIRPAADRWPASVTPDFTDIDLGLARTYPPIDDNKEVREVETLLFDSIARAERFIYIENQYLTVTRLAEALAKRLQEKPDLEAVMIAPKAHDSWLESMTMRHGRIRFMRTLEEAGVSDRARVLYPEVIEDGTTTDTMIHAKVMIVDDILVRVGSANLNNRSLGLDTECDLALEAKTDEQRAAVTRLRNHMLGHHLRASAEEVETMLARTGSLVETAMTLTNDGHALKPVDDGAVTPSELSITMNGIADAERPIEAPALLREFVGQRPRARRLGRFAKVFAIAFVVIALMLAWQFTPLATWTDPDWVKEGIEAVSEMRGAVLIVIALFVVGGLVAFPVTLLIVATAAAFGPLLGFAYAGAGALLSAIVTYGVGVGIGKRALEDVLGPKLNRIRRGIAKRGVLAVVIVRLVPLAPFTLVNLTAGASRIPFQDYVIGTIIGMTPGLALMSAMGHQMLNVLTEPTPTNVALFVAAVVAWVALSLAVQALILRWRERRA